MYNLNTFLYRKHVYFIFQQKLFSFFFYCLVPDHGCRRACEFRLSAECHSYPVPRALFNSKCVRTEFRSLSLDTSHPLLLRRTRCTLNVKRAFIVQPPDTYLQCYRETTVDLTLYPTPAVEIYRNACVYIYFYKKTFFFGTFFFRIFH